MSEDRNQRIIKHIQHDPFARFIGANVEILKPGHSRVTLTITDDMVNFHGNTHGGVIFALGDIAFAAASNSHGQTAVALNVGINFLKPTNSGDELIAEAMEQSAKEAHRSQSPIGPSGVFGDISARSLGPCSRCHKRQGRVISQL